MDVVAVLLAQGGGDGGEVLEERQHLVVGRVVGNEETDVGVIQDGSDTDQTGTATRDDGHVFPGVLRLLALTVHLVVHVCDGLAKGLDTGGRAILSGSSGDVDGGRSLEAALDIVFDLGSALTQVCPLLGLLKETIFTCTFGTPDDTGGGSGRIETGVGQVTLVGSTELTMNLGARLCTGKESLAHGSSCIVAADDFGCQGVLQQYSMSRMACTLTRICQDLLGVVAVGRGSSGEIELRQICDIPAAQHFRRHEADASREESKLGSGRETGCMVILITLSTGLANTKTASRTGHTRVAVHGELSGVERHLGGFVVALDDDDA